MSLLDIATDITSKKHYGLESSVYSEKEAPKYSSETASEVIREESKAGSLMCGYGNKRKLTPAAISNIEQFNQLYKTLKEEKGLEYIELSFMLKTKSALAEEFDLKNAAKVNQFQGFLEEKGLLNVCREERVLAKVFQVKSIEEWYGMFGDYPINEDKRIAVQEALHSLTEFEAQVVILIATGGYLTHIPYTRIPQGMTAEGLYKSACKKLRTNEDVLRKLGIR